MTRIDVNTPTTLLESAFNEDALQKLSGAKISIFRVLQAYTSARIATHVLGSDTHRKLSGTLKQYKKVIQRLNAADEFGNCPFKGLMNLENEASLSPRTLAMYRTALRSYAARIVLSCAPATLITCSHPKNAHETKAFFDHYETSYVPRPKSGQIQALIKSINFLDTNPLQAVGRFHDRQLPRPANFNRKPTNSKRNNLLYFQDYLKTRDSEDDFYTIIWKHFSALDDADSENLNKKLAAATFILTGCRASEYVRGVLVFIGIKKSNNQSILGFRISGTNVSKANSSKHTIALTEHEKMLANVVANDPAEKDYQNRGQDFRYIFLRNANQITTWLINFVVNAHSNSIQLPKKLLRELSEIKISPAHLTVVPQQISTDRNECKKSADRLGKMFVREGRKIFPEATQNLTPYVFRHALASSLRSKGGASGETLSCLLGHQSDRSKNHYGDFSKSRLNSVLSQLDVITCQPLRQKTKFWAHGERNNYQNRTF